MCEAIHLPVDEEKIRTLRIGDTVTLTGVILTMRDRAHAWLVNAFNHSEALTPDEASDVTFIRQLLHNGAVYHCGPVMADTARGYQVKSAGPTTSARLEGYIPALLANTGLRMLIGKGGMGQATSAVLKQHGAVYLDAVGGTGALSAAHVCNVQQVLRESFGMPEAIWVLAVVDFPLIVTLDAWGNNLHQQVADASADVLWQLINQRPENDENSDIKKVSRI